MKHSHQLPPHTTLWGQKEMCSFCGDFKELKICPELLSDTQSEIDWGAQGCSLVHSVLFTPVLFPTHHCVSCSSISLYTSFPWNIKFRLVQIVKTGEKMKGGNRKLRGKEVKHGGRRVERKCLSKGKRISNTLRRHWERWKKKGLEEKSMTSWKAAKNGKMLKKLNKKWEKVSEKIDKKTEEIKEKKRNKNRNE